MIISCIAAVAENNVIGDGSTLPWHLPDDMRYFMNTTKGHHVLTGRKNYFTIPGRFRPLKDRTTIILSRQKGFKEPHCLVAGSIEAGIALARENGERELFVIGGGEVYHEAIHLSDKLYITHVHSRPTGTVVFPVIDPSLWQRTVREDHDKDDRHAVSFSFCVYRKRM